jgi:metallo-beta-lactamase class B
VGTLSQAGKLTMHSTHIKALFSICFFLAILPLRIVAQSTPPEIPAGPPDWREPFPGHRVIGNLYAVGTAGLGVFLITSDDGHILINTGMEDSMPLIRDNIEAVGYRVEDVEILLTQQSHFDHTAALAEIKELTGAQMWATEKDARVLEDGGFSDPHIGGQISFEPVEVDRIIRDGEVIELGDIRLRVHLHPGHTEGSSSYSMQVSENGRDYNVVIANMGTINEGKRMFVDPTYPGVGEDFARTFRLQRAMDVDVWVAAHGTQYGLSEKYTPGQPYSPDTFVDPDGFYAEVDRLEQIYLETVAAERTGQ